MLELLDSISSENLVMICLILGVIALCLAIAISIEIYSGNKKYAKNKEELEDTQSKLNIKESANIKYVEEDAELEKTKAKMELEQLREKLRREEEEKQRLFEANMALEKEKEEQKEQIEILEDTIVDLRPVVDKVKEIEEKEVKEEKPIAVKLDDLEKTKEISIPIVPSVDYSNDEDDAIISYDELKNAKNFGYTDEEMYNNVEEKDAIISVQELEKLYYESQNIDVALKDNTEVNTSPSVEIEENKDSYVSSVYSTPKTDQDLVLEQTANLEKLNEEIRKTNEFLKILKDLKKNLD